MGVLNPFILFAKLYLLSCQSQRDKSKMAATEKQNKTCFHEEFQLEGTVMVLVRYVRHIITIKIINNLYFMFFFFMYE